MSKKLTFAEKIRLQKSEEEDPSPEVEEQVEVEKPKKTRKPRKKVEKVEEVEGGAVEEEKPIRPPREQRKPRKKKGEDVVECTVVSESKPVKQKRAPSAYNLFVKDAYKSEKVQKLPPKERFAKVAELWHKQKSKK